MNTFQPGLYRHIKGNTYYAYGTATHSESQETMVIYASANASGELWVRPLSMFTETLSTENGPTARFTFVGETADAL